MTRLAELVSHLDTHLRVADTPDDRAAFNGLQVDGPEEITRFAVAVDACRATIEKAAQLKAQLLIVHHGLFWDGVGPITGRRHARLAALIHHGIAVYSAHIPLDVHPELGNNAVLMKKLGIPLQGWWGEYEGARIGAMGELDIDRLELTSRLASAIAATPKLLACGPERSRRIGVVTGAAGSMIEEAAAAGIDTFITGEVKHHHFFDAEDLGVNVILGGHYATETVGVRALAEHVGARYRLPWDFIDHPTGL